MTVAPIPTHYAGYHFRSRLEARWAVFFDALQIDWSYEPEGYKLPDGSWYLPDFFLRMREGHSRRVRFPNAGYLIEIKPVAPSAEEREKLRQVSAGTFHRAYFFLGVPGEKSPEYVRTEPPLTAMQIAAEKRMAELLPLPEWTPMEELYFSFLRECSPYTPQKLAAAVIAARSARFEHGQSGATA